MIREGEPASAVERRDGVPDPPRGLRRWWLHRAALRYAALLALLGGLLAAAALATEVSGKAEPSGWGGVGRLGLAWMAATSLALSAGYLLKAAGWAPERRLPAAAWLYGAIIFPYTVFGILVLLLTRLTSREALANEVAPRVWVGGAPLPGQLAGLRTRGIDAVLNLCLELPDLAGVRRAGMAYCRVPLLDGAAPDAEQLRASAGWAAEQWRSGRTVLIHCAQGHGRSATAAALVLTWLAQAPDPEAARRRIQHARPAIRIGPSQRAILEQVWREGAR